MLRRGLDALTRDYAEARLIEQSLAIVRRIRQEHSIPADLGYVREAVRIALKIFGNLRGKTIVGNGPIADALLALGATRAAGVADLAISENDLRFHDYVFTMDDLDRMTREEMKKYYPVNFSDDADRPMEDVTEVLERGIKKNPKAAEAFKKLIDELAAQNDEAIADFMSAIIRQARS